MAVFVSALYQAFGRQLPQAVIGCLLNKFDPLIFAAVNNIADDEMLF